MTPGSRAWTFLGEVGLTGLCSLLALLTAAKPDWIESMIGIDPDGHGGEAEWLIVAGLATVAVISAAFAHMEWRRLRPS